MIFLSRIFLSTVLVFASGAVAASAQEQAAPPSSDSTSRSGLNATEQPAPSQTAIDQAPPDKRVFGVLPNYRTANESAVYTPITVHQKFAIASKDSFDYPLVFLAAGLAGLSQLTDQNPSFGQGMAGYGKRVGTSYADQAMGNMMTEAIFPSLLHEDPRYFRRATGSKLSRTGYALSRIFVTRTDAGGTRFNYSEVLGNATGVAISNLYYPDSRNAADSISRLGQQLATDAVSQVLKEFWPDIKQRLVKHKETER